MPIRVFVADEQSDRPVEVGLYSHLAERVLADRWIGAGSGETELNILFVDEESIASLNERFLRKAGPTDVLSFPIEDELAAPAPPPAGPVPDLTGPGREGIAEEEEAMPVMLGDVVICPEVAWRNAPTHAGRYEDELALLVVHGILHLLGMDHEREPDAEKMEALERELLALHHTGTWHDGHTGDGHAGDGSSGHTGEKSP